MLRRTRAEVGRELPALTKIPHTIDADTAVLEKAEGDAERLARIILARNERFRGEQMNAAGQFDAPKRQATGVAKEPFVAEYRSEEQTADLQPLTRSSYAFFWLKHKQT